MQKIIPFLWFDGSAIEAMNLYTSIFQNSKIMNILYYGEAGPEPEGKVMSSTFKLAEQQFTALNGGPEFTFTPAISFFVNCETSEEIDDLWDNLSDGGTVLIELGKYPISEKFGWIQDKFGVSWQLNLKKIEQKISPFLMFVGQQKGKAEEAIDFYMSLFDNSEIIEILHYGTGEEEPAGTVKRARFLLNGQEFMAIDSNREHEFTFTPAVSFFVNCKTQEEIDMLWEKLSEDGEKLRMGWLTDKYGVSWQVIPSVLDEMLKDNNHDKSKRVMEAMMKMDKMDIEKLKQAYKGKL
jgi:predicted 3-demethylubiquinone-9 3-methyltransferase (glyoxalase superfamily)